ncbi:MAG: UDP-N-acetylmuramate--L-alanine ligase [Armatimonadetes bacterium]|nr:UDP-N-acetylmuramate--L-alanine ligase [Armatimonadota bacterium]
MGDTETIHFIGIGGAGMSALAQLFLARGAHVTGSDAKDSPVLARLAAAGATVHVGHAAAHVGAADRVVYSAAIPEENPERQEACRRHLPLLSRAQLLGEVLDQYTGIAISGTHGKTTTTAMAAAIFLHAGADPTVILGGDWDVIGGNVRVGGGKHCLAEACEAFSSFLALRPCYAAITNIDADHLEFHGSIEGVVEAFRRFLRQVRPEGTAVVCLDDPRVRDLAGNLPCKALTYGVAAMDADLRAINLDASGPVARFRVSYRGKVLGSIRLGVPGRHNASNALAAIGLALTVGLPFDAAQMALAQFRGVGRRFERLGEANGVMVFDDYAHHPREIAATLACARAAFPGRRLWAVFQPHLYSRTQLLMEEFAAALADADHVVITEIYAARERPIAGVTGKALAVAASRKHSGGENRVAFAPTLDEGVERLRTAVRPGDVVLVMGAGDIRALGEKLVQALANEAKN